MDTKYYFENTFVPLEQIPAKVGKGIRYVRKYVADNYTIEQRRARSKECYRRSKLGVNNPMKGNTGTDHHNYDPMPKSDAKGYLIVTKPVWYTGRKKSRHVFQHSAVWCAFMVLTEVPRNTVIHHCDQNPLNNSFDNLLGVTREEHKAIHDWIGGATTISKESTAKWLEARRSASQRA